MKEKYLKVKDLFKDYDLLTRENYKNLFNSDYYRSIIEKTYCLPENEDNLEDGLNIKLLKLIDTSQQYYDCYNLITFNFSADQISIIKNKCIHKKDLSIYDGMNISFPSTQVFYFPISFFLKNSEVLLDLIEV